MVVICTGGTSAPLPATEAVVAFTSAALATLLAESGYVWITPVLPFLSLPPIVASTFCAADPPAVPTFTSAESSALLNLQFGADFSSGISKLQDLVLNCAWYALCHCTSGTLVPPGAAAPPPAGTPITTPPPAGVATPCGTFSGGPSNTSPSHYTNIIHITSLPVGATSVHLDLENRVAGAGPHNNIQFAIAQYAPDSAVVITQSQPFLLSGATDSTDIPIAAGAGTLDVSVTSGTIANTNDIYVTGAITCGGTASGQPIPPAAPLPPANNAQLEAILALVTLIQRQLVPFGYVPGGSHSVSGSGEISVQGLIGAKIVITDAIAGTIGAVAGDPEENFGLGWITWGSADGWYPRQFLGHVDNVSFPNDAGALTLLAYSLAPGVTATITELRREP